MSRFIVLDKRTQLSLARKHEGREISITLHASGPRSRRYVDVPPGYETAVAALVRDRVLVPEVA